MKLHIDTDIGGDPDDLCAIAMALNWPDAELLAVTTVAEHAGKRAGYVRHALALAGRDDIDVAAGADASHGYYRSFPLLPPEERYWLQSIPPAPTPVDDALDLLERSIAQGAAIAAIGPFTNLALLERRSPGILREARLFLMGGYVFPPPPSFPYYSPEEDYNAQVDVDSAVCVFSNSSPTLITLGVTTQTALRREHLPALRKAGRLARLMARQAEVHAVDEGYEEKYGLLNLHHDPLACAIALGWNKGVAISETTLKTTVENGMLRQEIDPGGRPARVVMAIDAEAFNDEWLRVCASSL